MTLSTGLKGAVANATSRWNLAAQAAAPANATYDPDTFMTRASDARGHTAQMTLAVPPSTYAQLKKLANSEDMPAYQSVEDVVRDAVYHHLHKRSEQLNDPDFKASVQTDAAMQRLAQEMAAAAYSAQFYDTMVEDLTMALVSLQKHGGTMQMEALLHRFEISCDDILEEPYLSLSQALVAEWREKISSSQ